MRTWFFCFILSVSAVLWAKPENEFFRASLNGDLQKVQELIETEGISLVQRCDKDRNTPLHLACCAKKGGHKKELIAYLLENGANINAKNRFFSTPLHIAVSTMNFEGTEVLVKNKNLEINHQDDNSQTVFHYAVQMRSVPFLKLLFSNEKANPNIGTIDGATPLHFAAMLGYFEEAEALLEDPRTDPNCQETASDYTGAAPLHFAAMQGHAEVVDLLIKKNANIHTTLPKGVFGGFSPVHFAVMNPEPSRVFETLKILFAAGANLKSKTDSGKRPSDLTSVGVIKQFLENPGTDYRLKKKN